jgi:hypothetical protein
MYHFMGIKSKQITVHKRNNSKKGNTFRKIINIPNYISTS